jgi:hypothetical protein
MTTQSSSSNVRRMPGHHNVYQLNADAAALAAVFSSVPVWTGYALKSAFTTPWQTGGLRSRIEVGPISAAA